MKNKKLLLNLIILLAVAFSIVSLFAPVISYDNSPWYNDYGLKPSEYWKHDYGIFYNHDLRGDKSVNVYRILHIIEFKEGKIGLSIWDSSIITNFSFILISGILLFSLFSYFCYKSIKVDDHKKTRYLFYAGISMVATISAFILSLHSTAGSFYNSRFPGEVVFKLGYGFYCMLAASILFFVAYSIQYYFVDFSEEPKYNY